MEMKREIERERESANFTKHRSLNQKHYHWIVQCRSKTHCNIIYVKGSESMFSTLHFKVDLDHSYN